MLINKVHDNSNLAQKLAAVTVTLSYTAGTQYTQKQRNQVKNILCASQTLCIRPGKT